ncbi:Endonuclease YncB, thermonuclease family [Agrobacterium fabrum]|uniref:thermonuclease family protein n=1 Tax=Agrobacterium fabrum TaxID=1176649 RepID=UPI0008803E74|nr:thermonuclease family protein [Agrobacterium fabrum]MDH6294624.1 endonuclease YncB(thermonuclease family) [Agrobacterium fabrum]SDB22370.1 Endonuclease YncB, thermonuclease family [Agrobacterium fabrum]SEQ41631.1 Endonuclease YncB, thermonuclease family [Agrobacterium fabrum]
MSNRKSTARRRTAKKSSGGSVWPWVLMLGVVAGGIQAYEYRDSLLPQRHAAKATSSATNSPKVATTARRDTVTTEKVASIRPASPVLPGNGPVPPRPIAMPSIAPPSQVAGILPETRPSVEKISLGEKSGAFAFCGRSGLNNCVADGNTFWMKGVKMQLAGIDVPQIDRARCMEERQRGFIAKVRLRDMLNAGTFDVASSGEAGGQTLERKRLSRSGVSFADQLVREGLAHPASVKNQSWCG